jgi:hypothetical protein
VCADTAASVASIAFQQPAAAVDGATRRAGAASREGRTSDGSWHAGNVVRVLCRLHALAQANPASSAAVKELQLLVRVTAECPCACVCARPAG